MISTVGSSIVLYHPSGDIVRDGPSVDDAAGSLLKFGDERCQDCTNGIRVGVDIVYVSDDRLQPELHQPVMTAWYKL